MLDERSLERNVDVSLGCPPNTNVPTSSRNLHSSTFQFRIHRPPIFPLSLSLSPRFTFPLMSTTDRQPLLPQHVNHTPHKLSTSRISFPPSSTSALGTDETDAGGSSGFVNAGSRISSRRWVPPSSTSALGADGPDAGESSGSVNAGSKRAWGTAERGGERQGLPKLSRECLWA
jgi:hypothetical protein